MVIFQSVLLALGLLPIFALGESMLKSKTLTIMVMLDFTLFGAFILFLSHMANIQAH